MDRHDHFERRMLLFFVIHWVVATALVLGAGYAIFHLLTNPQIIGAFFGEIAAGFNNTGAVSEQ
jgi:TPP-dependent pyruvate/acetoin dehydrogenase alpha subunit